MDIFDSNKLFLFIVFAIPGFIAIKTYSLLCPNQEKDSSALVIDAITYSCINYAILGPFIYLYLEKNDWKFDLSFESCTFYIFAIIILPALLALFWLWLRNLEWIRKRAPHPIAKPWDFVFSNINKSYYVLITLSDGRKIAGEYSSNSFTSSYPEEPQIYLEKAWLVNEDNGFDREVNETEGVLILGSDIQTIEFFKY